MSQRTLKRVIYVDAGFSNGQGRIAWLDETTNKSHFEHSNCKDNFRCEYAALVNALDHIKEVKDGDEVEIRSDSEVVVKQLNHQSAINDDDIRKIALKIWEWGTKWNTSVSFVSVPRKENKAGKILGN
jgi:ribonuclease HI